MRSGSTSSLHVGCCGFRMARARYFERFASVEVQQTFYHPPQLATLERWRAEAPEGFVFTVKAWQLITHTASSPTYRRLRRPVPEKMRDRYGAFQPTEEVREAWRATLECARALEAPVIVFQCPSTFKPTDENIDHLYRFFGRARRDTKKITLAWEPRGKDWTQSLVRRVCRDLHLVHVVDPTQERETYGSMRYFRLHGPNGYHSRHTDADLEMLAERCRGRKPAYCMFNNASMADDARRFAEHFVAD